MIPLDIHSAVEEYLYKDIAGVSKGSFHGNQSK